MKKHKIILTNFSNKWYDRYSNRLRDGRKKSEEIQMTKKPVQLDENGKRKFAMRDCLAYAAGDLGCNMFSH